MASRLDLYIAGDARQFNKALGDANKLADKFFGDIASKAQSAATALAGISAAGGLMVGGFLQKAGEMEQFKATLTAVTGSAAEAEAQLQRLAAFAAKTPFELPSVVKAGVQMRALGVDAEKFLPLAGNLAAVMGRDIPDAALALGKALTGSQDGIQVLADSYGIAKAELVKFGAAAKSDGSIDTSQLEKLQGALEAIITSKFGDAMGQQSQTLNGALSNLNDSIGQLQAALGAELVPMFTGAARALTEFVSGFQGLSPAMKSMISQLAVGVTGLAALGATLSGLVAVFGPLVAGFVALRQVMAASAAAKVAAAAAAQAAAVAEGELAVAGGAAAASQGLLTGAMGALRAAIIASPLGAFAVVLGLVSAALVAYTDHLSNATVEQERKITVSERAQKHYRDERDAVQQAAEALREYGSATEAASNKVADLFRKGGKTELDATKAIAGLMDQLRTMEEQGQGDSPAAQKLRDEIDLLRKVRVQVEGLQDAKDAAAAKEAAANKQRQADTNQLLTQYKEMSQHGVFKDDREQLAALDKVLAAIGKQHSEFKNLSYDRVKLARKAAEEETKAAEKGREDRLAAEMHYINLVTGSAAKDIQKRIQLMRSLLAGTLLNKEERRKVEIDLQREVDSLEKAQADARKKRDEEKRKKDEDSARTRVKAAEAERKGADSVLQSLQAQYDKGEPVLAQLERQIALRDQLDARLEREKAKQEGLGKSAGQRAAINAAAEAEIDARKRQSALEVEKLRETAAKRDAGDMAARADLALEQKKIEEEALRQRLSAGEKVGSQLKQQVNDRQAAERESLLLKASQDAIGASAEERSRIRRDLEIDLTRLGQQQTTEMRALTAELERQKALKDEERQKSGFTLGGVTGVEGAGDFSAFDVKKDDKKDAAPSPAQLKAEQAASKKQAEDLVAKSGIGAEAGVETNRLLADMVATLKRIEGQPPVTVKTQGATAPTEAFDWRSSTNKCF